MRCEPPIPAQFISTRAMPCELSALASAALTCSPSVTSACSATPLTSAATFSAFSLLWSSTPILAPLAAMARAVAAPRPEPPPVMTTATSFNCMTKPFLGRFFSRLLCRHPNRPLSGRHGAFFLIGREHAATDQRFHVADILATDFVSDRTDAGRARHRGAGEEQMIAGPDQAGVKQHRIDLAELAGLDAFGEQAAMKIQQR